MSAKVHATVEYGSPEPYDTLSEWQRNANGWTVQLRYQGRKWSEIPFYTGLALGEPTAEDVLECLLSDACGFENARGFEDWCSEYGYDTDSRSAERIYRQVEKNTERLRQLLGDDYPGALYDPETSAKALAV